MSQTSDSNFGPLSPPVPAEDEDTLHRRQIAGLIGGIGPESTIEYYRGILAGWRATHPDGSAPYIVIDSIDVQRGLGFLGARQLNELTDYLLASARRLAGAGCTFAAMAANSPHVVFDALAARSPIPLVSIIEATADAVAARGMKRVTLLGTRFTMSSRMYPEALAKRGITRVIPAKHELERVHTIYIEELLRNRFLDTSRNELLAMLSRMRREEGVDGVILGGTELPLLFRMEHWEGLPLLDTTRVHVDAIVERLNRARA